MEVSDAAMLAGISAAFVVLKKCKKETRKIPAIDVGEILFKKSKFQNNEGFGIQRRRSV